MTEAQAIAQERPTGAVKTSLAWLGVAAFIVFLFDPGIMSNDSIASLKQARSLEFTDWHPPLMALIWGVLDRIIAGPAGMLLAQAALFAYACAALCARAFPTLSARMPSWLLVAVFSLFPPMMTIAGMIWKDIWMSAFLLLALAHLFRLRDCTTPVQRRAHMVAIVLFCLAASAFRHNALAATAGLLAGAAYLLLALKATWLRLLVASVAGVVASIVLYLLVSLATGLIATPAHPATAIYLHDIAGVISYSDDREEAARLALADPTVLTDDPAQFLERIDRSYDPAAAGRVIRTSRNPNTPFSVRVYSPDHDAEGVVRVRNTLIRQYPRAYMEHRARAFACLLQLCDRRRWISRSYVMNEQYALPDSLDPESWQHALRQVFLSPRLATLYHPGFWLLVTLVGGSIGLARLRGPRPSLMLFMGLSSAGLAFSLYFTSPIESFRYMHWTIVLGWAMLFLAADAFAARLSQARTGDR